MTLAGQGVTEVPYRQAQKRLNASALEVVLADPSQIPKLPITRGGLKVGGFPKLESLYTAPSVMPITRSAVNCNVGCEFTNKLD